MTIAEVQENLRQVFDRCMLNNDMDSALQATHGMLATMEADELANNGNGVGFGDRTSN